LGKLRNEQESYAREMGLTQRIEYTGGNAIYIGKAFPGTLTSEAKWQICKLTYDGDGNMTALNWCQGLDSFEFVWDDRATAYNYS